MQKFVLYILIILFIGSINNSCRPKRSCCSSPKKPTSYYNRKNSKLNKKIRKSRAIQHDNMVLLTPPENNTKESITLKNKSNLKIESNTDFVFSTEKSVVQNLNFKFGSFKYHNPQCNDIILLENIEIENTPRFFTRTSFEELWKLYIFLQDYPKIHIKINGYPNKTEMYKDDEAIKLTASATQNVQKFLLHQNIEIERIPFEAANKVIEKRKLPFYLNQPFWIEIVIKKL